MRSCALVLQYSSALQILDWAERWLATRREEKRQDPFVMTLFLTSTHHPYSSMVSEENKKTTLDLAFGAILDENTKDKEDVLRSR